MKVLSLLQPWATLVVIGAKKIETRSWNTFYRGPILIHASKRKDPYAVNLCIIDPFDKHTPDFNALPFGAIIGKCEITETLSASREQGILLRQHNTDEIAFGDYNHGRHAWRLANPVQFKKATPAKGSLSLWEFKEQICLKCGCTENNACISPMFGPPCWWEGENLCSHCLEGVEDVLS